MLKREFPFLGEEETTLRWKIVALERSSMTVVFIVEAVVVVVSN